MAKSEEASDKVRVDLGLVLIGIGIVGIVWGVLFVLNRVHGPEGPPQTFAERTSYNMAKRNIHMAMPGGLLRSMAGLTLAMFGGHLRRRREEREQFAAGSGD